MSPNFAYGHAPVNCGVCSPHAAPYGDRKALRTLEHRLQALFGFKAPLVSRSASEGFLCVLLAWGIGPHDEVVLPVSICHSMTNAVLMAGATPVFADCDENLALCVDAMLASITPRTRCVVAHHPFGMATSMR